MDLSKLPSIPPIVQYVLLIWSIAWKGIALWNASKNSQKNWFIAILVINTIGILEIIYLFYFCKKRLTISSMKSFVTNLVSKK